MAVMSYYVTRGRLRSIRILCPFGDIFESFLRIQLDEG